MACAEFCRRIGAPGPITTKYICFYSDEQLEPPFMTRAGKKMRLFILRPNKIRILLG